MENVEIGVETVEARGCGTRTLTIGDVVKAHPLPCRLYERNRITDATRKKHDVAIQDADGRASRAGPSEV
jgi:hypothetical protein